jgi:osmotically-inducible protein OsmY
VDDPDVAKHLSVETKDGVVTISGHAFTGSQAGKVLRDAQSVSGVVKVQNHISLTQ